MKAKRFTEEQITFALRQAESGTPVSEIVRKMGISEPTFYRGQIALRMRMRDLAMVRVGYDYRRLHILLDREGWAINHKRLYRLYREENLGIRRKPPRRRVACLKREFVSAVSKKNDRWRMHLMSDQLYDGRRIRLLTIVDNHTRESPGIHVSQRIRGHEVVMVLEKAVKIHGKPKVIQVDNGPSFISKDVDLWAYWNQVKLDFSRPGKPTDNAYIESFNARIRQECLNENWFLSLEDAREKVEKWWRHYNNERPHSSIGNISPTEFAATVSSMSIDPKPLLGIPED